MLGGGGSLLLACCLAGPAVLGAIGGSLAGNAIVAVAVASSVAILGTVVLRRFVTRQEEC